MRPPAFLAGLLTLAAVFLAAQGSVARAAGPPQIGGGWVGEVTAASARLSSGVNANGLPTQVRFEYLPLASYLANLGTVPPADPFSGAERSPAGSPSSIGSGSAELTFLRQVTGLAPGTAYRYRLLASNVAGSVSGPVHSFTTEEKGAVFVLPDGRGWEMVSPGDKNGGAVEGFGAIFGGGVLQAAAGGGAATFTSSSSFGVAQGSPGASQYLSRRGAGGWSTENITTPLISGSFPSGAESGVPYQIFSTDLATGLLSNGRRCRGDVDDCAVANPPLPGSGAPAGYRNYYLRDSAGGTYRALLGPTEIAELALPPQRFELALAGASPDLSQVLLSSCAALTAQATEVPGAGGECDPAQTNLYRSTVTGLTLVNLLPGDTQGTPGATLAASAGAVSSDGSRVYWRRGGNLYLREGAVSKSVDGAEGGGGTFQTASSDGSVAFFTKAGHLYRYEAGSETTTDLTPGGEVEGVLGASADGSAVYYLTPAGLFLRQGAITTLVAAAADASNYPPATGTARVSADGTRLVFLARASLTGYDNTELGSGQPVSEVYIYDATAATLTCASCNPTEARPLGPSSVPGATANGKAIQAYKPRVLSAGGTRLFFDSRDSLVSLDTNADSDVYEWEANGTGSCQRTAGCVALISSGRSEGGADFVDASADGSDAFFVTDGSLVPSDPGSIDLYDARVGGGFPLAPTPIPCVGDACQPLPGEPEDPTSGTLFYGREGNPPLNFPKTKKSKPKKKHHKKKHPKNSRGARR